MIVSTSQELPSTLTMSTLIFDIETVGDDFDSFDQTTQDGLTRWVRREPLSEQEASFK